MTQFVVCKFAASKRGYTYRNDGERVSVGDRVVVQAPRDEGNVTVEVTEVDVTEPSFACKPILGKAAPKEERRDALDDGDDADFEAAFGDRDALGSDIGF